MFLGLKYTGMYYCADYTAASPVFTQTSFPFGHVNSMALNPFNANQLLISTFGDGMFSANIGTTASRPAAITNLWEASPAGRLRSTGPKSEARAAITSITPTPAAA